MEKVRHWIVYALLCIASALLLTGCRIKDTVTKMERTTSSFLSDTSEAVTKKRTEAIREEKTRKKTEFTSGIPADTATVIVPVQAIAQLPEGAQYLTRNKRASVSAERKGDNLVITGRCDSAFQKITLLEEMVFRQREEIDSLTDLNTKKIEAQSDDKADIERITKRPSVWKIPAAFLLGLCLLPIIKRIINLLKMKKKW